jgi:serine/threonine protein kinase
VARFIRNYEIVQKLGGGKFGEVFLAAGETPGRGLNAGRRRVVAVKKLRDSSSPSAAQLLMQEFALLDQVKHRGIVRVFEYIQEENAVVMEAVDGVTLRQVLDECDKAHEQVFTEAVIEIACELADALYQAYTTPGDNGEPLRLVHRDLKPENIMLTPSGEVKILDFGLARVDNADFQREDPNRLRGTPLYMAPEQAQMREVDHRTDLFALGLITYELLMGRAAYRVPENSPDPVAEVYDAIERAALQDCIAELESKIPGMGPIIARCLQARPQSRYQNGQELLVDLRRQLYRDRGAYLEEFCEFFFGSIYDHDPLPTLDKIVSSGPAPSGGRRRMSIEERLKQSMERERAAAHEAPLRSPPISPAPAAPPRGGSPQRAKPFSPPGSGRAPGRPQPSASPATPPAPPSAGSPRSSSPRMVGARSPDETGMLELVPLSADGSGDPEVEDPSATAFFAIPAPRAQDKPAAAPAPAPAPPPSAPAPVISTGMPPAAPPMGGIQGPTSTGGGAPPPAPVGIQGPTASGPVGTPFQASQPPPSAAQPKQQKRVSSFRVYALLLAVFMLGCMAVVTAVWVGLSATKDKDPEPAVTTPAVAQAPVKKPKRREDTGDDPEPEPKPRPTVRRPTNPSPAPAPAPAPAANPGVLKVTMTDQTFLTTLEVTCPSGFRQRAAISPGGSVSISNVPNETCVLHFKGGAPARFSPVSGGKSLSCYIQGTTAVCK